MMSYSDPGPPGEIGDCPARSPGPVGFYCTLDAGHSGDHVAHGISSNWPLATWPRDGAPAVIDELTGGGSGG
jgi:hypothetical protein